VMSVDTTPRTGPANAVTNDEGHRWYIFGEGDQEERYLSVTTALGLAGNPDGLIRWAAGLAADAAIDALPKLIRSTRIRECGNTYKRCQHDFRMRCTTCPCGECGPCVRKWVANRHYYESSRRAEEGKRAHNVQEWWALNNGELPTHEDDIAPYVKQFLQWVADYGLTPDDWEMSEATIINRTHGYAGTLDAIITIHADRTDLAARFVAMVLAQPLSQVTGKSVRTLVDTKTREKAVDTKNPAKLYPEHALQQTGYRYGEVVRLRDGREEPMPLTDGAAILQIRPDGYLFRPVVTDDTTFRAFLSALNFAKWHFEFATKSISPRTFTVPKEPAAPKPAKAAATKRAPAKKAAPKKRVTTPPATGAKPQEERLTGEVVITDEVRKRVDARLAAGTSIAGPHPNSLYQDDIPF
jgi:hypothetical protein